MAFAVAVLPMLVFVVARGEGLDAVTSSCVLSSTECTCSEHPASGVCTSKTSSGKCIDGECQPSMRCDCFGFEKCAISTCGKWEAVPPAVRSLTKEFQCQYNPNGTNCRTVTDLADTVEGSKNAQDATVVFVDEAIVDEREVGISLATCVNYKVEALSVLRNVQTVADTKEENLLPEELSEVQSEVNRTVLAVQQVTAALVDVANASGKAYEGESRVRLLAKQAKAAEDAAVALEEQESQDAAAAADAGNTCTTCEDLKTRAAASLVERAARAEEAGAVAQRVRAARKAAREVRNRANELQIGAEEARSRCGQAGNRIIQRLAGNVGGGGSAP